MASISEILLAQGRHAAESKRARAGAWQPLMRHLANLPGQVMRDRAAERAATETAFDRQQQRDVREQTLAKGEQELQAGTRMGELLATPGVIGDDGRFDVTAAQRFATEKGYTDILDDILPLARDHNDAVDKGLLTQEQINAARRRATADDAALKQTATEQGVRQIIGARMGAGPLTDAGRSELQGMAYANGIAAPAFPEPVKPDTRLLNLKLADAIRSGDKAEMNVIRQAIRVAAAEGREPQGAGTTDPGPLETIIGPDGKPIRVRREDAIGKAPASGTEKASSGVQKRVLNFFNRAEQADKDLEKLEPEIEKLGLGGQAWQAIMPNFAQTQLGQSYTAAQRAFTEARLRKDSGAAIPAEEFDSDRKTYFVQPGDSKKTIQQKNRARAAMLASLAFESGQALGEYIGDADEAKATVDRYKARASGAGGQVVVTAPDGSKHTFATKAEADNFKRLAGIN